MLPVGTKEGVKAARDQKEKVSHGEKDHGTGAENPTTTTHEKNGQIVKDVKDAIKDVKDALKEYRQEEPSKPAGNKATSDDVHIDMSCDDSSRTKSASENSSEIKSALSILHDMRVDSKTAETKADADINNEGYSSDVSKSDEEGHFPMKNGKFSGAGSYIFNSSENVDEYLKELGVGLVFRKVQSVANPSLTIFPYKSNEYGIKMDSIFRTREIKFQIGEEFTDETFDGRPCRSVATIEASNRLSIRQRCPTGPDVKVIYESLQDNSILMTMMSGSGTARLRFIPNDEI
jgi:hypothetical protein